MFDWGKDKKSAKEKTTAAATETKATEPSTSQSLLKQPSKAPVEEKKKDVPTSVFEFGPIVTVGSDMMRGMCAGEDTDAIQACTWTIEPAQGKPREKKHAYRIEF